MSDWHELQSKLTEKNTKMDAAQVELLAAAVHADWVEGKLSQGVTSRCGPDGEEYMVPYAQLSEAGKELDRATVRAVLKHLPALAPAPASSSGAEAGVPTVTDARTWRWATLRRQVDAVFERLGCLTPEGEWLETDEADEWRPKAHAIYAAADKLARLPRSPAPALAGAE
ncbi:RyR domain-containing protein [Deinococcus sp. Leaf326]|uniref:RyR domain-containing protein n=1 Tax=Deinococcus sp. Leaf326 TaxID=1736338 RepID=UPI0006F73664|nr:RyR domain-containing protein [Deinococcus sp. Leaf326]KQR22888.1 hypothetical protein ASF71_06895 [Deinococcus sp. Leaf326]